MLRERNTMVGTPTLIAPEAIRLTADFAFPGEDYSVLAAISSVATAQYFPRVQALSPLISTSVELAKSAIGESAQALPAGSILLAPTDSHAQKAPLSEDVNATVAIATVAAVFETAGQKIEDNRDRILAVATDAYHELYAHPDADGFLAVALHGGFAVSKASGTGRPRTLSAPKGLNLVLFRTGYTISKAPLVEAIQEFAERDHKAYAPFVKSLEENGNRFIEDLSAGNSTSAIASFHRYGQCLMAMAAAVSIPIASDGLSQAISLAKEIGGAIKPSALGSGDLAVALFGTPEAAAIFIRACQPPLVPLSFSLDSLGVRCRPAEEPSASEAVKTPEPERTTQVFDAMAPIRVTEDSTDRSTIPGRPAAANMTQIYSSPGTILPRVEKPHPETVEVGGPAVPKTAPVFKTVLGHFPVAEEIDSLPDPAAIRKKWILLSGLGVVSLAILLWSALPVMRKTDDSFRPRQPTRLTEGMPMVPGRGLPQAGKTRPGSPRPLALPAAPAPQPAPTTAPATEIRQPEIRQPKAGQATDEDTKVEDTKLADEDASDKASSKGALRGRVAARTKKNPPTTASSPAEAKPDPAPTDFHTPPSASPRAGKLSTDDF